MSLIDSIVIATIFGVLTCMVRFAVFAWMPNTLMADFFRKTLR